MDAYVHVCVFYFESKIVHFIHADKDIIIIFFLLTWGKEYLS